MNVYARIRKIEEKDEFKRLIDALLGAEYLTDYQSIKEWKDGGIDGYNKNSKTAYAFYCPRYPERRELQQYRDKISSDIKNLKATIDKGEITFPVEEWIFVTPDDLPTEIMEFTYRKCQEAGWKSGTLTAQVLAPLFMKHSVIQPDFPNITAGIQFDKIPSIDVRMAHNRDYTMLEFFNDGTEDIKSIEASISTDEKKTWQRKTDNFLYEFEEPFRGYGHSLFNLKKGERQYCNNVPTAGQFYYKVSGIGVESGKTYLKEDFIDKIYPRA